MPSTESDAPAEQSESRDHKAPEERLMPCPQCGYPMPDLRGGKGSICANCGYKDSCCF